MTPTILIPSIIAAGVELQLFLLAVLIASTLVHELGHVIVGRFWGYRCIGVRWLPPGVHLRGPRGAGGIAPLLEAITVALGGPVASVLSTAGIWIGGYHAIAFLWALCGILEFLPFIPNTDGNQIYNGLLRQWRKHEATS